MKFILGKDGTLAINAAFVKTVYIEKEDGASFSVIAEVIASHSNEHNTTYNYNATLATFDGNDIKANLSAAQNYLAELIDKLNGGKS